MRGQINSSLLRSNGEGDRSAKLSGGGAGHFGAQRDGPIRNRVYVEEYLFRRDSNYFEAQVAHVVISTRIMGGGTYEVMDLAVHFNHEFRGRTVEVGNIGPNRVLFSKANA